MFDWNEKPADIHGLRGVRGGNSPTKDGFPIFRLFHVWGGVHFPPIETQAAGMLQDSSTGVRCVTYRPVFPPNSSRNNSHPEGETRGKVVTIVWQHFEQIASVITCQKKRKESPPNDPEASELSLTSDPVLFVL